MLDLHVLSSAGYEFISSLFANRWLLLPVLQ